MNKGNESQIDYQKRVIREEYLEQEKANELPDSTLNPTAYVMQGRRSES